MDKLLNKKNIWNQEVDYEAKESLEFIVTKEMVHRVLIKMSYDKAALSIKCRT